MPTGTREIQPIGHAQIRRPGSDITVVTWGSIQDRVLQSAQALARQSIAAEVIDARWVRPLDLDLVLDSVRRTGRLAVVHEAHTTGGVGGEVVSAVAEAGIALKAPPIRIGAPPTRIPAAPALAEAVIPTAERITRALASAVTSTPDLQPAA
ncbi:transketolase C-terminal domain-containing protein [Streptomyces olivaceoviridis]|uniref:transketolase C-terminal domain-containing protein n=1 Tax=Streptomyces olivaceoviridis TaxID=1921 RepID=UPI0036774F08